MGGLWKFIRLKSNRERIAWLGGGAVVVVAGLWTAFVYFFPLKKGEDGGGTHITANCGSVALGGSVSGATINAGGTTNSNCATKPN
jgi:hypothetical protein